MLTVARRETDTARGDSSRATDTKPSIFVREEKKKIKKKSPEVPQNQPSGGKLRGLGVYVRIFYVPPQLLGGRARRYNPQARSQHVLGGWWWLMALKCHQVEAARGSCCPKPPAPRKWVWVGGVCVLSTLPCPHPSPNTPKWAFFFCHNLLSLLGWVLLLGQFECRGQRKGQNPPPPPETPNPPNRLSSP